MRGLAIKHQVNSFSIKAEVKQYARILYMNYRARALKSGHEIPEWGDASPIVKKEFFRNARNELGY